MNQRLKIVADDIRTPEKFVHLSIKDRVKIRDAFTANLDLIDSFVEENIFQLTVDEIATVRHKADE